ncbi:MAG: LON peptidase substrate-binding domain-containing protein [Deltaproteobacteria bacterium]|jgi:Lon protease-like protein|nr:LON peptidase substrate-binding domain-containing protein [Deltaproteobacteria bacterium]
MNVTFETRLPLTVPVMPLDGHVLLPMAATPYRVSDPRHRRLVQDLLEKPADQRWLAVPPRLPMVAMLERPEHGESDSAELAEVAALGLLTVATPLDGGEFIIVVEGRSACRLESAHFTGDHQTPYRMAKIRHLVDRPEPLVDSRASTATLIQAYFCLCESFGLAADLAHNDQPEDDIGLVYRLGSAVIEDPSARALLLSERCPARRREQVLNQIIDQMAFAMRERLLGKDAIRC